MGICELKARVDVGRLNLIGSLNSLGVKTHWESQPSGMNVFTLGLDVYLSNFSKLDVNATCGVATVGPGIKVMSA